MTRAQRMRRNLIALLCERSHSGSRLEPYCFVCLRPDRLEVDHVAGRRPRERNRNPKHRRKSALQRVIELWQDCDCKGAGGDR
jgi:hypothetical protein